MSVLIKGIEMPTSCSDCDIPCDRWMDVEDGKRSDDCPLVHVQPHGRLIDADAFEKHIKEDWQAYDRWIAVEVENRPTVLEAEEGE